MGGILGLATMGNSEVDTTISKDDSILLPVDDADGEDDGRATVDAPPSSSSTIMNASKSSSQQETPRTSLFDNDVPIVSTSTRGTPAAKNGTQDKTSSAQENPFDSDRMIGEHLADLAASEQAMKEALQEASTKQPTKDKALNNNKEDDWADDWLQALMEIRDEPDYEEEDEGILELLVVNGDSKNIQWDDSSASDSNTIL
jgi:hypothetical protein